MDRVVGVDALKGRPGRMGRPALEAEHDLVGRQKGVGDPGVVGRMGHQHQVHIGEQTLLDHLHLAAVYQHLLGRGSHDADFAPESLQGIGQSQPCGHGHQGDEVVPASVPQLGQGVVLGQKGQMGPSPAEVPGGREGRLHAARVAGHAEAEAFQYFGQLGRGPGFFKAQFGVAVDILAQIP